MAHERKYDIYHVACDGQLPNGQSEASYPFYRNAFADYQRHRGSASLYGVFVDDETQEIILSK